MMNGLCAAGRAGIETHAAAFQTHMRPSRIGFDVMMIACEHDCDGLRRPARQPFAARMPESGKADIDIGDGYRLQIDKASSQVEVIDPQGNRTTVNEDPHFSYDGQHVADFKQGISLKLANGTEVSIDTKPGKDGGAVTFADRVTVTRGDRAMTITGIDQESAEALQITASGNGRQLRAGTQHALVLDESATGWVNDATGRAVSQSDFDRSSESPVPTFGNPDASVIGLFLARASTDRPVSILRSMHHHHRI